MIINFNETKEAVIPHFKDGEGALNTRMFSDGLNRIIRGRLEKGSSIGLHTHEDSSEIIYILSGTATVTMDGETEIVLPGNAHYCPKGHSHMMENCHDEDLCFFAVVPQQ